VKRCPTGVDGRAGPGRDPVGGSDRIGRALTVESDRPKTVTVPSRLPDQVMLRSPSGAGCPRKGTWRGFITRRVTGHGGRGSPDRVPRWCVGQRPANVDQQSTSAAPAGRMRGAPTVGTRAGS